MIAMSVSSELILDQLEKLPDWVFKSAVRI